MLVGTSLQLDKVGAFFETQCIRNGTAGPTSGILSPPTHREPWGSKLQTYSVHCGWSSFSIHTLYVVFYFHTCARLGQSVVCRLCPSDTFSIASLRPLSCYTFLHCLSVASALIISHAAWSRGNADKVFICAAASTYTLRCRWRM